MAKPFFALTCFAFSGMIATAHAGQMGTPESCQAALLKVTPLVGKSLNDVQPDIVQIVKENMVRAVRIFHEGDMITMDMRLDRLSIELTPDEVIKKVGCS